MFLIIDLSVLCQTDDVASYSGSAKCVPYESDEFRHLQRGQCWQKLVLGAIPEIHQLNEVTVAGNEFRTALLGSKTVMLALLGFLYFVLCQSPISLRLGLIA